MSRWSVLLVGTLVGGFARAEDMVEGLVPAVPYDAWSTVTMAEQPVGRVHTVATIDARGDVHTEMRMDMGLLRGGLKLEFRLEQTTVESADGLLRSIDLVQSAGSVPMRTHVEMDGGEAVITSSAGDQVSPETRVAIPEECRHGAGAADRRVAWALANGAREVVVCLIDPSIGVEPARTEHRVVGLAKLDLGHRVVETTVIESVSSGMGGVATRSWIDDAGRAVRTVQNIAGIELVISEAPGEPTVAEGAPPELFLGTLIEPSRPVPDPRRLKRAVWTLSTRKGAMPALPTEGPQSVRRLADNRQKITVDLSASPAVADDFNTDVFLGRSAMIDGEDPAVVALVEGALASGSRDLAADAERLRAFVYDYIAEKNLGTGFAGSHEVASRASGDCTEHAVLLAAMLRHRGIPARVASGLVFIPGPGNGIFGFHMWTQALMAGDDGLVWRDLDATIDPDVAFDATHIAVAVSALTDAEGTSAMVNVMPLLGNLDVKPGALRYVQ